jgi:phosphoserine phosphatase
MQPVAEILSIPEERVFANRLLFDENGTYGGFDAKEPTSRSGGKAAAIAEIKKV